MSRVSENSSKASVNFTINKTRQKLEDLQLRGSTLRKIRRPSDNPTGSVKALELKASNKLNEQYQKNLNMADLNLSSIERSLEEMANILTRAKELAISQASDFYSEEIRENISMEVTQLKNQMVGLSNLKIGNRYLFAGQKSTTKPFDGAGNYYGDGNNIEIEVYRGYRVPITLNGRDAFFLEQKEKPDEVNYEPSRGLASEKLPVSADQFVEKNAGNLIKLLGTFEDALKLNDKEIVQSLLVKIDQGIEQTVRARTQAGAFYNTIQNLRDRLDKEFIDNKDHESRLVDADVAQLFSDISQQQQILNTAYKSSQVMLNQSLLDFLK